MAEAAVGVKIQPVLFDQALGVLMWGCICLKLGAHFSNIKTSSLTATAPSKPYSMSAFVTPYALMLSYFPGGLTVFTPCLVLPSRSVRWAST